MHQNEELYKFLVDKVELINDEWYESLYSNYQLGSYTSSDFHMMNRAKQQNNEFNQQFCRLFIEEEETFFSRFGEWIKRVARDENYLGTPIEYILREFFRIQEQFLDLISEFVRIHDGKYSKEEIEAWYRIAIKAYNHIIGWFTNEQEKYAEAKLKAHQETINKISSPVIFLNRSIALLPIVGEIDASRAEHILKNTVVECSKKQVELLLIDLSGVIKVDQQVAEQLFQLINSVHLIGVEPVLSGIRPEIARAATHLGIRFDHVSTVSSLEQAINKFL